MTQTQIEYRINQSISVNQFIDVLMRSSLAERRPVNEYETVETMLAEADILVTAWAGERLVGVARAVSDFSYCCYLSDLAVDVDYQKQGIGRRLLGLTRDQLGPLCLLILLAAPAAAGYYPQVGFTRHDSAWILKPGEDLI